MHYISTRGHGGSLPSAAAIIAGIAADGGLFVPAALPAVDRAFLDHLADMSYRERAFQVLRLFLTDYSETELRGCLADAYGAAFDCAAVAPLRELDPACAALELWHGPTSAFKDMALQLLPRLMSAALRKTGQKDEILILTATSGDTGKAALEGFKDVPQIRIIVFYPQNGVSRMQYLQMAGQTGGNVAVVAVEGNFDDAQTGVKEIFSDASFNRRLQAAGVRLSSANSINWGRLAPQIVYYFSAYADWVKSGRVVSGQTVNFVVPTGNFGNILAGYYAKQMGLPVGRLICASNANHILTDFLTSGVYDRNRAFYQTISPSMDILVSSNLERLLYCLTGGDAAQVAEWMADLKREGRYEIGGRHLKTLQELFWAGWADDAQTAAAIRRAFEQYGYAPDTHTAVAIDVNEQYRAATGDATPAVIVSTASPYKFSDSVLRALAGAAAVENRGEFELLDALAAKIRLPVPRGLSALRDVKILHHTTSSKENMQKTVQSMI